MNPNSAAESLYTRATRIGPTLPQSQGIVANYFAQQPDITASSTAIEIAHATNTSDATVIRTANALGFRNMKELRRAALNLVQERVDPEKVLEQRIERVQDQTLMSVLDDTIEAASRTRHTISEDIWAQAISLLDCAPRVFCFGLKPVGFIADYMSHMLNRIGVDARSSTESGVMLADFLLGLGSSDALIIFAPIRQFDEITASIRHAKRVGASTILITEAINMPIRNEVDCTITTYPTSMSSASDQTLPLTVAHGLFLGMAAAQPGRAKDTMSLLNILRPEVSSQDVPVRLQQFGYRE